MSDFTEADARKGKVRSYDKGANLPNAFLFWNLIEIEGRISKLFVVERYDQFANKIDRQYFTDFAQATRVFEAIERELATKLAFKTLTRE